MGSGALRFGVLGSAFSPALTKLFAEHSEAVFDYLSFRRDIETIAAERASIFASDTDLLVIDKIYRKMEAAHSKRNPADEAELDAQFHMAIIEASHNVIMLHMMRSMFELLREGVFYNRSVMFKQRTTRDLLLDHHRAINQAIQDRDPQAARAAIGLHLTYVEQDLLKQKKSEQNEEVAKLRYQQENAR